jgi:hypothetical protein
MTSRRDCPGCGRPMPAARFGVVVSELKARIIDRVRLAGDEGISAADLIAELNLSIGPKLLAVHINQLNEKLVETDYELRGRGPWGRGYRLIRRRST